MALQIIAVNDAAPGACVDTGATYNGTDTITFTSDVVATDVNVTTLTSAGSTNLTGNLAVNTDKFTVAGTTGNTAIAGNLTVGANKLIVTGSTGAVHMTGALTAEGGITAWGDITTQQSIIAQGMNIYGVSSFGGTATFNGAVSFGGTSHAPRNTGTTASLNTLYDGYSTSDATNIVITLPTGLEGQIKIIQAEDCNTGYITVTPSAMAGGTSVRLSADRQTVAFVWCSTRWRVVFTSGTIIA